MHLTNMTSSTLNKHTYLSTTQKRAKYRRNPSIHLTCENPIIHLNKVVALNMAASMSSNNTYKKQSINTSETLIIHLSILRHIIKIKPKTQMHGISNV